MTTMLRMIGLLGLAVFITLLLLLQAKPDFFKRSALSFTKAEVTRQIIERYPNLQNHPAAEQVKKGLGRLAQQLGRRQARLEGIAASEVPEQIGRIVENICSCGQATPESIAARSEMIRESLTQNAALAGVNQKRLTDFLRGRYEETITALRHELVLFLTINALAFAAILGASFVPRDRRHAVAIPAALLLLAVLISALTYLFGTNWFYAILFQDYAGIWYGIGLLIVFGFLLDIVVNRAWVTLRLIENLPSALTPPIC